MSHRLAQFVWKKILMRYLKYIVNPLLFIVYWFSIVFVIEIFGIFGLRRNSLEYIQLLSIAITIVATIFLRKKIYLSDKSSNLSPVASRPPTLLPSRENKINKISIWIIAALLAPIILFTLAMIFAGISTQQESKQNDAEYEKVISDSLTKGNIDSTKGNFAFNEYTLPVGEYKQYGMPSEKSFAELPLPKSSIPLSDYQAPIKIVEQGKDFDTVFISSAKITLKIPKSLTGIEYLYGEGVLHDQANNLTLSVRLRTTYPVYKDWAYNSAEQINPYNLKEGLRFMLITLIDEDPPSKAKIYQFSSGDLFVIDSSSQKASVITKSPISNKETLVTSISMADRNITDYLPLLGLIVKDEKVDWSQ